MSFALIARKQEAESAAKSRAPASSLRISEPNDAFEQEADRVADEVMRGDRVRPFSIGQLGSAGVQRQGAPTNQQAGQPQPNNYSEGLKKLAEAFLETDLGKKLKDAVTNDPLVKGATDFFASLPGKVVAGAAATGAVATLAATHKALPAQLPAIPLDAITPGLKVQIDYEGPVNHPTQATITFSYSPGGEKKKKPAQTQSERYRAETARMAADQEKFRAGMKYKPGSKEDLEQKAQDKLVQDYFNKRLLSPVPGLKPKPLSSATDADKKKEETAPVQRKAAVSTSGSSPQFASPDVLPRSAGRPLDTGTRTYMESRFGFDFSKVRIHSDADAAASAKTVNALAYTVGNDVIFGEAQYSPASEPGKRLLAHELTHTVQQNGPAARVTHDCGHLYRQTQPTAKVDWREMARHSTPWQQWTLEQKENAESEYQAAVKRMFEASDRERFASRDTDNELFRLLEPYKQNMRAFLEKKTITNLQIHATFKSTAQYESAAGQKVTLEANVWLPASSAAPSGEVLFELTKPAQGGMVDATRVPLKITCTPSSITPGSQSCTAKATYVTIALSKAKYSIKATYEPLNTGNRSSYSEAFLEVK
ncbi:MAG: DUF4157 domain-containing protein [Acidobacteriaceae bacterium]|nr:DUF4157 domain-containing protein [Acidobacteriaceae bacterium]